MNNLENLYPGLIEVVTSFSSFSAIKNLGLTCKNLTEIIKREGFWDKRCEDETRSEVDLGLFFKKICRDGNVTAFDNFHKNHCIHEDKNCKAIVFSPHNEKFWRYGFKGAIEGNHAHIIEKILALNAYRFYKENYDTLKNPNVNFKIIEFNSSDITFIESPTEEREECIWVDYGNRKDFFTCCEMDEEFVFKCMGLDNFLRKSRNVPTII